VLGSDLALIDRYVAGLASALRGPRRLRDDMVAEARHSLLDASEVYLDEGMTPGDAARRAIAEFGHYHDVVPGYQAELAAAQGRRTTLWMATALPVLNVLAPLMWWNQPWSGHEPIAGFWTLRSGYDYLSLGASVVALLLMIGFGWGSRYVRDGFRYARGVGVGALIFLAVHGVAGTAVFGLSVYQWPVAATWPPIVAGIVANSVAFGYAALTAWRCVVATQARFLAGDLADAASTPMREISG
jgi:hypothetical protein